MILADFHFPRRVRAVATQIARVVCPPEAEELGLIDAVVSHFEMNLRSFPPHMRTSMCAGMMALEASCAFRPKTLGKAFSRLPPEEAREWFEAWWASPISLFHHLAKGVKALLAMSYWEQPAIKAKLQFHPDAWIAEVAKKRVEQWGVEIARHEQFVRAPDPLVISPQTLVRRRRHA
jgi:hypothetical protein